MPPRYGKTELAVKSFIEWCLAKAAHCRFMHLSYSENLALDNSAEIKEDVKSEWYQEYWPVAFKKGDDAKASWETTKKGKMYATGTMGSLTGFGAGILDSEGFSGAIIIDDPLKPEEAFSDLIRDKANDRLNTTILNRRNDKKTPVIIIMQRIHEEDMTGFVLSGETGEEFVHLSIPVIDENGAPLWPEKHDKEAINKLRKDASVFAGQYMQSPVSGTGNMFTREMFEIGPVPKDGYDFSYITADTAYTDKKKSDYNSMTLGGNKDGQVYIDKIFREKVKAERMESIAVPFIKSATVWGFRGAYIEPKGHGIYLNQKLPGLGIIMPTEEEVAEFFKDRKMNKVERCNNVLPHMAGRKIIINEMIPNAQGLIDELIAFPRGKKDDFVDTVIDLCKLMFIKPNSILNAL